MRTRKVALLLSVTCLGLLVLGGCGSKKAEEVKENVKDAVEETVDDVSEQVTSAIDDVTGANAETDDEEDEEEETTVPEEEGIRHLTVLLSDNTRTVLDPDTQNTEMQLEYETLSLGEQDAALYPELAAALEQYNEGREDYAAETYEELDQNWQEIKEFINPEGTEPEYYRYLVSETKAQIGRADSVLLSVVCDNYSDFGGAHPNWGLTGANIDAQTGQLLTLGDVVTDQDAFTQLLVEKVQAKYADIFADLEDIPTYMTDNSMYDDTTAFVVDSEGISYIFSPYAIGPYALGQQIVFVSFAEAPELFNSKYTEVPDNYFLPLIDQNSRTVDVNGDGVQETVSIEAVPADDSEDSAGFMVWNITSGDQTVSLSDWCYSEESRVVRNDGNFYLYTFEHGDDDYTTLVVTDLDTLRSSRSEVEMEPSLISEKHGGDDSGYYGSIEKETLNDPALFTLSSRLELFGTYSGSRVYRVGADGYPDAVDENYSVRTPYALKLFTDLECETVDVDGNTQGKESVPEGTCLRIVRSDGEKWIDVQVVDDSEITNEGNSSYPMYFTENPGLDESETIYRITTDSAGSYPLTVNGVSSDEIFAGMTYAG